ncbi:hypothetical protein DL765_009058 [Monosporascus sp. GIB2]|nr:hypothetical protein DL765_009058 [Monosporascus sp. GIB2]
MESKETYDQINRRYGSITRSGTGQYEKTVAKAFGYTEEELDGVPEGANLGLSCGNPLALARLREGETVIDLGSGAGLDVFTASKRVGPTGKAIGIDMNKNMIDKANANKARANASNVQFIESAVTSIALPDNTADCIISNCVINLVPPTDKQLAFNEMFRLLKPGGRVAISDILARKEFTDEIKKNVALYVGCVAGASQVSEYDAFLKDAGFKDTVKEEEETPSCCTSEAKASCCKHEEKELCCGTHSLTCACRNQTSSMAAEAKTLATRLGTTDLNELAGSFKVYAVKPAAN